MACIWKNIPNQFYWESVNIPDGLNRSSNFSQSQVEQNTWSRAGLWLILHRTACPSLLTCYSSIIPVTHTHPITCWGGSFWKETGWQVSKGRNHLFLFLLFITVAKTGPVALAAWPSCAPHVGMGALRCSGSNWWERCSELRLQCCSELTEAQGCIPSWGLRPFSLFLFSLLPLCTEWIDSCIFLSNVFSFQMYICICMPG